MITIRANPMGVTELGRLGENLHRRIEFDVGEFAEQYPNATYSLMHQRAGDNAAYPVENVTQDGTSLYWTVTNSDLTAQGQGKCELIVVDGDVIAKSIYYLTVVLPALDGSGEAPSPWDSMLEQFEALKEAAEAAAQSAAESAAQAAQYAVRIEMVGDTLTITHVGNQNQGV